MKEFIQTALSYLSTSGHPKCLAVSEQMHVVDLSIKPEHSDSRDGEPSACRYLIDAFSSANAIQLAEELAEANECLVWREGPREVIPSPMHDNHAFVEIISPDADYRSDEIRFGVFLMAPNVRYPLHSHSADEIYIIISGSGQWRSYNAPYELKQPGSIVHIPSWEPHAILSNGEPLLMLWAHFGDIDFEKYRVEQDDFNEDVDQ